MAYDTFHPFPRLPVELRELIWYEVVKQSTPRIIRVIPEPNPPADPNWGIALAVHIGGNVPVPVVLRTNTESRRIGLDYLDSIPRFRSFDDLIFPPCLRDLEEDYAEPKVWINLAVDTLYFRHYPRRNELPSWYNAVCEIKIQESIEWLWSISFECTVVRTSPPSTFFRKSGDSYSDRYDRLRSSLIRHIAFQTRAMEFILDEAQDNLPMRQWRREGILNSGTDPILPKRLSLIYSLCRKHECLESVSFVHDATSYLTDRSPCEYYFQDIQATIEHNKSTELDPGRLDQYLGYGIGRARAFWDSDFAGPEGYKDSWEQYAGSRDRKSGGSKWRPRIEVVGIEKGL